MQTEILCARDPAQREVWRKAWGSLPPARRDVYFLPEHTAASEAEGRGEARCFLARAGDALLLHPFLFAPIPRLAELGEDRPLFDIQTPYGYGGPLASPAGEDASFLRQAWEAFSSWCGRSSVVAEFCRFHPLLQNERWADPAMRVMPNRPTVYIDLSAYEAEMNTPYYKNHRQAVRRAGRACHTCVEASPEGRMRWFAEEYAKTQDVLGAAAETRFGPAYIEALASGLGGRLKLWLGQQSGRITAATLFMESDTVSHGHLMAYGSEPPPNGAINVMMHEIAMDAARRGMKILHLGGGTTADPADSLLAFK